MINAQLQHFHRKSPATFLAIIRLHLTNWYYIFKKRMPQRNKILFKRR